MAVVQAVKLAKRTGVYRAQRAALAGAAPSDAWLDAEAGTAIVLFELAGSVGEERLLGFAVDTATSSVVQAGVLVVGASKDGWRVTHEAPSRSVRARVSTHAGAHAPRGEYGGAGP